MMGTNLATDLRCVSSGLSNGISNHSESLLTRSLRNSLDQPQNPWVAAADQLSSFPTKRCVQMLPADWQELSGVLNSINRQCQKVKSCSSSSQNTSQGRDNPGFVAALELLAQLGRVTSCLLCVNGDDMSFSIARVAQVRTHRSTRQCACCMATFTALSLLYDNATQ